MLKNNELLAPDMLNRIAIPGCRTGPHLNKVLNPEKIVSQPFWTYLSQPPHSTKQADEGLYYAPIFPPLTLMVG